MFGIGMPELILIAVVALIVLGPNKLPDLAKSMGRALREFRKATSELKETFQVDSEISEAKKAFSDFHSEVNKAVQGENTRPEPPATAGTAAQPVSTATAPPAEPESGKPSASEKLEELNKSFEAWNAEKSPAPKAAGSLVPDPPPIDKTKSA